jgi:hypothetical protein
MGNVEEQGKRKKEKRLSGPPGAEKSRERKRTGKKGKAVK